MRRLSLWAATAVCLTLGCASPTALNKNYDLTKIRRVGVLSFEDRWAANLGAEDIFAKHLIRRGYSVIERSRLEAILREQKMGAAGVFAFSTVKGLGKILGVDDLIIGQITSYEPVRKSVVYINVQRTYSEPIFEKVKRKVEIKEGEKKGKEEFVIVHVRIGTKTRHEDKQIPQLLTIDARVGLVAKLVDIETGEIIWVGSASREGVNAAMAVESAVSFLVRKLRKKWKPGT